MKIAMVSNLYPPDVLGGYELLARDVAEWLARRGHVVDVVTSGNGTFAPDARLAGGGVWRGLSLIRPFDEPLSRERLRTRWFGAVNARAVETYLRERGVPDAVLAMSQRRLGLAPLRTFAAAGVPLVGTINDDWPLAYVTPRGTSAKRLLDAVGDRSIFRANTFWQVPFSELIYLSETLQRAVSGTGLPAGRVCAQGVDRRDFPTRPFRTMSAAPRLLFVGRLHPTKAPDVALEAVAALHKRGVRATLRVAGAPFEERYGNDLRELARSLGVSEHVEWLGPVPRSDLAALHHASDALLFPGRFELEGQGLVYLEAMSSGLLVVAHPTGGARELLAGRDVVELVGENTGAAFAEALVRLRGDEGRQRDLVERAQDFLTREASLERYVDVLEDALVQATTVPHIARTS